MLQYPEVVKFAELDGLIGLEADGDAKDSGRLVASLSEAGVFLAG